MRETRKGSRGYVLVVEDDPDLRETLTGVSADEVYRVATARTGLDAVTMIEKARTEKPNAILLDLMMPQMNGFQLLDELRAQAVSIPVIVISAYIYSESDAVREFPSASS